MSLFEKYLEDRYINDGVIGGAVKVAKRAGVGASFAINKLYNLYKNLKKKRDTAKNEEDKYKVQLKMKEIQQKIKSYKKG